MAKNMQPIAKRCKALGISPAVMGYSKKETKRNPGGQMRKKKSEYAIQLNEKGIDDNVIHAGGSLSAADSIYLIDEDNGSRATSRGKDILHEFHRL